MVSNFIVVIAGPTGSGKTELSCGLADKLPIEIVNCDIGQMYQPCSIGTAKPEWQTSPIPHHLFDIITEPTSLTVVQYRALVQRVVAEIWRRKKVPVLVGGSLFYSKSFLFPPVERIVADFVPSTREQGTWQELYHIDPERAQVIDKQDDYRIQRALDIWYKTGQKPSELRPQFEPFSDFSLFFVWRERKELYDRINARTQEMIEDGWIDEVAQLSPAWKSFLLKKRLIGYPEIIYYLQEKGDKEKLIATIQKKTRNYAKRQLTFWRSFKPDVHKAIAQKQVQEPNFHATVDEVNLTLSSSNLYLENMISAYKGRLK